MNREHFVVEYRNGRKVVYLGSSSPPIGSMQQYRQLEAVARELGADLKDPNRKADDWLERELKRVTRQSLRVELNPPLPPLPFSRRDYVDEMWEHQVSKTRLRLEADELFDVQKKLYGIDRRRS